MNREEAIRVLGEVFSACSKVFPCEIHDAYLYGSFARGDYHEDSDVDIFLALDGIDRKHHSGVISEFRRLYIKTGVFDTGLSEIIESVFRLRSDSDYNDFFIVSKDEVVEQVEIPGSFWNGWKTT